MYIVYVVKPSSLFLSIADDPNLKAGIMSLANLLKIPEHEDPLLRLHVSCENFKNLSFFVLTCNSMLFISLFTVNALLGCESVN
jgi:hypothetical protein